MVDVMLFGMELVGSLLVFDVLFMLVSMIDAWKLLVRWLGNVGLFMLGCLCWWLGQLPWGGSGGWR